MAASPVDARGPDAVPPRPDADAAPDAIDPGPAAPGPDAPPDRSSPAARLVDPSAPLAAIGAATLLLVAAVLRAVAPATGSLTSAGSAGVPTTAALVAGGAAPVAAALVPVLLAVRALADRRATARRAGAVAAAAAGLAVLAPGALVADLALVVVPQTVGRPELAPAAGLSPVSPGAGAWLLLAGDALAIVAGVLAVLALRAAGVLGEGPAPFPADAEGVLLEPPGRPAVPVAGALLAVVGLLAAPFSLLPGAPSGVAGYDPRSALDAPAPLGSAVALLALGAVVAAFASGQAAGRVRRAGLGALAVGLAATVVPTLVAALTTAGLTVSAGPPFVLLGAAVVAVGIGGSPGRTVDGAGRRLPSAELRARAPGLCALLAAAASLVAALAPTLTVPAGTAAPAAASGSGPLLVPAAVVLAVPGLLVLAGSRRLVARVRPTLSVAWLAVPFAAGPVLDVVLAGFDVAHGRTGAGVLGSAGPVGGLAAGAGGAAGAAVDPLGGLGQLGSVGIAVGGWSVLVALALAVLTAAAAFAAGAAERRDVGAVLAPPGGVGAPGAERPVVVPEPTPDPAAGDPDGGDDLGTGDPYRAAGPREPDRTMLPLAALAAVLAVPAFLGPLVRDTVGAVGRPWDDPSAASWGSLAGLLAVAVAVLLAPRARPARALALLAGAAGLVAVRLSALVLTPPAPGEDVGAGPWAAGACLVAVLAAVGVAITRIREHRRGAGVARVAPGAACAPPLRG